MRPTDALAYRRILLDQSRGIVSNNTDDESAIFLTARDIVEITADCETYYVSADMTAVAIAAAKTMPEQVLRRGDLPSARGFMLYDHAVGTYPFVAPPVPIWGVIWSVNDNEMDEILDFDRECVCTDLYTCPGCRNAQACDCWGPPWDEQCERCADDNYECTCESCRCGANDPIGHGNPVTIYPLGRLSDSPGCLVPIAEDRDHDGHVQWTTGSIPVNDFGDFAATLLATWTLMQQSLSVSQRIPVDRPERRRCARANLPQDVLIVRLRRHSLDDSREDVGDPVPWSHRWLVSGHWRNQWLPSRACHRLQWIAGYVKGPENKPLVVKDRVTAWVR
jgi:hypothetical protein